MSVIETVQRALGLDHPRAALLARRHELLDAPPADVGPTRCPGCEAAERSELAQLTDSMNRYNRVAVVERAIRDARPSALLKFEVWLEGVFENHRARAVEVKPQTSMGLFGGRVVSVSTNGAWLQELTNALLAARLAVRDTLPFVEADVLQDRLAALRTAIEVLVENPRTEEIPPSFALG